MSVKRILGLFIIFFWTSIAWMILGGSNSVRTSTFSGSLKKSIQAMYGDSLDIDAPKLMTKKLTEVADKRNRYSDETKVYRNYEYTYYGLEKSDIKLDIKLDRRKKGNLWFPTFKAHFSGEYKFKIENFNPYEKYYLKSTLKSENNIYNNVKIEINGKSYNNILEFLTKKELLVQPNSDGELLFNVSYEATGMENLNYFISPDYDEICQVNNFKCTVTTNFEDYDFPSSMLSPSEKTKNGADSVLVWSFDNTITGKDIGIVIPNNLNPGEITSRVSFFAPISLLFFFIVLSMIAIVYKQNIHPMHFFFLALSFFSFHLMFSYFSDQMDIYLSFSIASVVSLLLTVTYVMHFLSKKMSFIITPAIQIIYLIVFSFSFFFDGMTGLIVTICSVITLFVLMQITAKQDWNEVFKRVD